MPPVAIFTAAKRLELPTRAEGFDEMYRVTFDAHRAAVVMRASRLDARE